ncbi:hypothetical protein FB45DRAFT_1067026 [Roridomyces roridus]|uniref:F-box domain-containing protein n=1 Tax=Roridomyces roridus TaxID=1738132 RepID=A0AAD7FAI5_9AGAR|nr:hypothetical protein FB45DRAFT_1067026 [Roridomyces roridus]
MDASICSQCGTWSSTSAINTTIQSLQNAAAPGTRLHALIYSNDPPEPAEIPLIQSFAPEIDASLASLDAEIWRLQERLRSLKKDRSELLDHQRVHKSILSPLRRMPPEILAEIFVFSLPTVTELFERQKFQIEDSPWVWTHICSRWRTVAISTPTLWSLILTNFINYDYPLEATAAHIQFLPHTDQLTHYYADAPWDVHSEILRMSSSLVTAHINMFPDEPEWSALTCGVIPLSHLRCLYVSHVEALAYFKTPLLDQITLDLLSDECDFLPVLEHFLADSSSTLRKLGLRRRPNAFLASKILRACPELTELAIIINHLSDRLADGISSALIQLLIATQGLVRVPRLARLHIAFEGTISLDHELYAQMLESRWNMQPRVLQAATVCFERELSDPDSSTQMRLETLRNGGLDLTFLHAADVQEYMAHWLCRPQ